MRIVALLLLSISSVSFGSSFSVGPYIEYPLSNGVETRFTIEGTDVEVKVKAGVLNQGYVRGGSQILVDRNTVTLAEAINCDHTYEAGTQFQHGFGSTKDSIDSRLYFDAGYGFIQGHGTLRNRDTLSLFLPFEAANNSSLQSWLYVPTTRFRP